MKKKQIIGGAIALLAVFALYKVFSKPKGVVSGGAEGERSAGQEGQPSDQGGYSGGGYGGGYSGGGYSQPSTGNQTTTSSSTNTGSTSSGQTSTSGGGLQIDMGKYGRSGPTPMPSQPAGSGSQPRTNPYINNAPTFNTVRDTKSAIASAGRIQATFAKIPVATSPTAPIAPRIRTF